MHADEYYRHVAGAALQRLRALIPASSEGTVFARVTVGRVAPEILRAAQADTVVVGTQSRSRLGRRMFGVMRQPSRKRHVRFWQCQLGPRPSGTEMNGVRQHERHVCPDVQPVAAPVW
jgi:hypothetical protein